VPIHQVLDPHAERRRDAGQIGRDLTGAAGFPLRHRAARHADRLGQLILGPALLFACRSNAGADVSWVRHCRIIRQLA
jgi:hypothetical protein